MNEFPLDKNKWYSLRDDRTRRVDGVKGFENFSVAVVIDSGGASLPSVQMMALIAVNILARWCRKIKIEMAEDVISCIPHREGGNFAELLKQIAVNADPHGQFIFGNVEEDDFDETLIIGQTNKTFQKPHVWINGSGWIAGVSHGSPLPSLPINKDNPIGPAFASCLGVAEIFRHAVSQLQPTPYSAWYSLYDFSRSDVPYQLKNPEYTSRFDFGRVYQVGCGAVGSSLDFLLSLTNWEAEIILIDHDQVDWTNCNRSLSFNAFDALERKNKVEVCGEVLRYGKLRLTTFNGDFGAFIETGKLLDAPPDLLLCLANGRNVWATIQNNFPPIVFHVTTTPSWGLNFGRHIPKREWCIMCRFSKEIKREFVPPCSEGEIEIAGNEEEPVLGVLPFLSTSGAILALAEMGKMQLGDYPVNRNFIEFSMKSPNGSFMSTQRSPQPECICKEQVIDLYPAEMKNSRFWKLVVQ
jgi:hypothetical protein